MHAHRRRARRRGPEDSDPEREIGKHLLELYRFAEGLPFVRAATERDPGDWEAWTQLGRALANTGDETAALAALTKADEAAGGRQDAWRNNMRTVLKRMAAEHKREGGGDLSFAWNENAAEIFRTYLVPFYTESRAELARRYGFTPGPTAIEVFAKHEDFSVRSTGFEGFPALGVCFGPVVTAVSPLSELRGTFSWARTSYHEFTHVIHLGLSHNRCPRWITEGLATWEEENKNPAWTRNMRRDLVDALANDDLIPVRELNRAFRGPRILFGYYQGGLLCQMLIDKNGFPPMVRLLESFDRGADVDQAFQEVYKTTPEAVDRDFRAFVQTLVKDLRIEPRWSDAKAQRLRLSLSKKAPADAAKTAAWADGWCTLAWHAWQGGKRVDAQEHLRTIASLAPQPARAQFLRGEMKLKDGDKDGAKALWEAALAAGVEDYRVRMALGMLAREAKDDAAAEAHFLAAEKAFPGFDERTLSAELQLAALYEETQRHDLALEAKERWLVFESGSIAEALEVARWHASKGRNAESLRYFQMANEIDPFRWRLHEDWGAALAAVGKHEEALREFGVALQVPAALEGDREGALGDADRARVLGRRASSALALGRADEASEDARAALELDPDCASARDVLERLR
ncbi:MAG: tetratricopeptide repeat protein [Planctomycetes bacterium]|nr:tetratricopeptide repeat protein [Planctomycetota bacterium]